jgi:hypothetical protein
VLSELGQQSPEPLADLDAERKLYWAQAGRAASWLDEQPRKTHLSMRVLTVSDRGWVAYFSSDQISSGPSLKRCNSLSLGYSVNALRQCPSIVGGIRLMR